MPANQLRMSHRQSAEKIFMSSLMILIWDIINLILSILSKVLKYASMESFYFIKFLLLKKKV